MEKIPENIKAIINSVIPLVAALILFLLVGNFGISKINDIRAQIDSARVDQNVLTQKLSTLQALSGTISNYTSAASTALPDANTSLAVTSQLKNLAIANTLLITNLKSGGEAKDTTGLSRVDITFDADGGKAQIISFLKSIAGIAPITTVDKIQINESGGMAKANVTVKSYWAALPATLPTTTQALNSLTPDEQAVLTQVSTLSQPTFVNITPTSGGRSNPFAK